MSLYYRFRRKRGYEPLETSVGKIGTLICYDIEFPEPSRILALKGADGCSKVVSPMGEVLAQASDSSEEVLVCEIDMDEIARVREKIPYLKEYDKNLAPAPELR